MFVLGDVAHIASESTLGELQERTNFYLGWLGLRLKARGEGASVQTF